MMGVAILVSILLSALALPLVAGVLLKLILDAVFLQFSGQPFRYLNWPITVLIIVAGSVLSVKLAIDGFVSPTLGYASMLAMVAGIPALLLLGLYRIFQKIHGE